MTRDIFQNDDRVVDNKAGRNRQRHEREVVEREPCQIHDAERPDDRNRHGDRRIAAARPLQRKTKTTPITRTIAMIRVISVSCRDARIVVERSAAKVMSSPAGSAALSRGIELRTSFTVEMILAPGWRKTMTRTAGFPLLSPRFLRSRTES